MQKSAFSRAKSRTLEAIELGFPIDGINFTFAKIVELRGRMTALLRMARLSELEGRNSKWGDNCKPLLSFFLLPFNRKSK